MSVKRTVADVGQPRSATRTTRRAMSAVPRTSRSSGRLTSADSGRASCCFNLRRTACLCATSQGFAGDLGGVIEDCVFSRSMVNAMPISGPSPAERNKMERYRRCRSASAANYPSTTVGCRGSAAQTPRTRRDAVMTSRRTRRPVTAGFQTTRRDLDFKSYFPAATTTSGGSDEGPGPRRALKPMSELIPRLYQAYGYQFTTSYRRPVATAMSSPRPTSRQTGAETSDDDTATTTAVQSIRRVSTRRTERDRTYSTKSLKHSVASSSPLRHHRQSAAPTAPRISRNELSK